jgi:hypothetical protein
MIEDGECIFYAIRRGAVFAPPIRDAKTYEYSHHMANALTILNSPSSILPNLCVLRVLCG